jgi:hypothetical protein
MTIDGLPGAELIRKGLDDLAQGVESTKALLVSRWRTFSLQRAHSPTRQLRARVGMRELVAPVSRPA